MTMLPPPGYAIAPTERTPPQVPGPQLGKIISYDPASRFAYFTLNSFGSQYRFGPALVAGVGHPAVGAGCVVIFVGAGVAHSYIVAYLNPGFGVPVIDGGTP